MWHLNLIKNLFITSVQYSLCESADPMSLNIASPFGKYPAIESVDLVSSNIALPFDRYLTTDSQNRQFSKEKSIRGPILISEPIGVRRRVVL